jgi:uncharacterized phage protein (TIGR01671 family)
MIPRYRAWDKIRKTMYEVDDIMSVDFGKSEISVKTLFFERTSRYDFDDIVLMQSTGLTDKNGKEIFEGDVVTDGYTTGDIKYHTTYGFYMVDGNSSERWFSDGNSIEDFEEDAKTVSEILEVVGNIYENQELVEVK